MLIVGRFAPSPTGSLHFGSLVAAAASYLAARQAGGKWLLRIEDIDKPREQPGAADSILRTLEAFGLHWDESVTYQSQRLPLYQAALAHLTPHTYPCACSRKDLQQQAHDGAYGLIYPGTCRDKPLPIDSQQRYAIRLRTTDAAIGFNDQIQGNYYQHLASELGDFIIRRADGWFAYQLAVVVDDALQGVNQVVRGADLLDNTPRQLWLQQLLGYPQPSYAHIPLALAANGQKLSKQNFAPAVTTEQCLHTLLAVWHFLGQITPPAKAFANPQEFWGWAITHWNIHRVPRVQSQIYHQPIDSL